MVINPTLRASTGDVFALFDGGDSEELSFVFFAFVGDMTDEGFKVYESD